MLRSKRKPADTIVGLLQNAGFKHGDDIVTEFLFAPPRRWRFDVALPDYKVSIEYNGLKGAGGHIGRHRSWHGAPRDWEKMNAAQELGWRVFQCGHKGIYAPISPEAVVDKVVALIRAEGDGSV